MIKQSIELRICGSHGEPFVAHATASESGVHIVVAEQLGRESAGDGAWDRLQEQFLCDVFVKDFTWAEFGAFSSLAAAGAEVLSENQIYQHV